MWRLWRYGFAVEVVKSEWVSGNQEVVGILNQVLYILIRVGKWERVWVLKKWVDIDP